MPSFMLKQPDGKIAVFSTVVDNFTAYGMDEAEAMSFGISEWGQDATERKIKRALDDEFLHSPADWPTDGLGRWRLALSDLSIAHGVEKARETMIEIGFPDADIPDPRNH